MKRTSIFTPPQNFSPFEKQLIEAAIMVHEQSTGAFEGPFTAAWLLNDFDAPVWHTANRNREEFISGKWKNTITVDWDVVLPDGLSLLHPRYSKLLETLRKIAFLTRSGIVGTATSPKVWRGHVSVLFQMARWAVLHDRRYRPSEYGFALVDQQGLNELMSLFATGGWPSALQSCERLLAELYRRTFSEDCPKAHIEEPLSLPEEVANAISEYLRSNDFLRPVIRGAYTGKRYVAREKVCALINENPASIRGSTRMSLFLRQFETDYHATLLIDIYQEKEFPDQKTLTRFDALTARMSNASLLDVSSRVGLLLSGHRHLASLLPEPSSISIPTARKLADPSTRVSGHHLFMPVDIGLQYLNSAIRMIHVFGDAIVEAYLDAAGRITASATSTDSERAVAHAVESFRTKDGESLGAALNIHGFIRPQTEQDFAAIRRSPTLDEALRALIGSCVVGIGLLKPSREQELAHLRRQCLLAGSDGYYIDYLIGKSGYGEFNKDQTRPIPNISAHAIKILQRLGEGLVAIYPSTRKAAENLFYLPKRDLSDRSPLQATPSLLNDHLDAFCDFMDAPVDELGRRWYVRTHEMRKWFLLLLFWHGRYGVLDAARWIAGHTNSSHIYAYIEHNFPGMELPAVEAEYAVSRLIAFEAREQAEAPNETGLAALYQNVLKHFGVRALAFIPSQEWHDYVTTLRQAQVFWLRPYSLFATGESGVTGLTVSFVMGDGEHE